MAKTEVCPFLVNGRKCVNADCLSQKSHNPSVIDWWIKKKKTVIPCRNEWQCWAFDHDRCLFWHSSDFQKSVKVSDRAKTEVCPLLVNGRECLDTECLSQKNHNSSAIDSWIKKQKTVKLCRNEWPCWAFEYDRCLFLHSPDYQKLDVERQQQMFAKLEFSGKLQIPRSSGSGDEACRIEDWKQLSSFSKINDSEIMIPGQLVPSIYEKRELKLDIGEPAQFAVPIAPLEISRDRTMSEPKPSHSANYSYEPLVRSVQAANPGFDFSNVNVITTSSTLRQIHTHLSDDDPKRERITGQMDRYDLQWKDGTLFLKRWADDPYRRWQTGYSQNFKEATCSLAPSLQGTRSHHRVFAYTFAGLNIVTQSRIDAYSCSCHQVAGPLNGSAPTDGIEEALIELLIDDTDEKAHEDSLVKPRDESLIVHRVGRNIPVKCLTKIVTHSEKSDPNYEPQLYFYGLSRVYNASHRGRVFEVTANEVADKSEHLHHWERMEQHNLRNLSGFLACLIANVQELAKSGKNHAALLLDNRKGELKAALYVRRDDTSLAPESFSILGSSGLSLI